MTTLDLVSLILCWGASTALWLWFHLWGASEYPDERRAYLRFAWLSPVWPLVLIAIYTYKAGKALWSNFKEAWL